MSEKLTYSEKLKDPRWQKRRLELLDAADWTCRECRTKTETLHVHHGLYRRGVDPWDYEDAVMHVLCESCHEKAEEGRSTLMELLAVLPTPLVSEFAGWIDLTPEEFRPAFFAMMSRIISGTLDGDWPEVNDKLSVMHWIQRQAALRIYDHAKWAQEEFLRASTQPEEPVNA